MVEAFTALVKPHTDMLDALAQKAGELKQARVSLLIEHELMQMMKALEACVANVAERAPEAAVATLKEQKELLEQPYAKVFAAL